MYRPPDKPGRLVVVPIHGTRPVTAGPLRGIIADADLTIGAFKALL